MCRAAETTYLQLIVTKFTTDMALELAIAAIRSVPIIPSRLSRKNVATAVPFIPIVLLCLRRDM